MMTPKHTQTLPRELQNIFVKGEVLLVGVIEWGIISAIIIVGSIVIERSVNMVQYPALEKK